MEKVKPWLLALSRRLRDTIVSTVHGFKIKESLMPDGTNPCNFRVGQVVHHLLFDYRGVIIGADRIFKGTEEWYRNVARSGPPRDKPWYHVLVHGAIHQTYVAERNLELDPTGEEIVHPLIDHYFLRFSDGAYIRLLN